MSGLERRMHLLLDDRRYQKVAVAAARQDISVAAVIRQAIDRLPDDDERRRTAIDSILGAPRISVPADPADLRREVDDAHDRVR